MSQFVRDARIAQIYEGRQRHPGARPGRPQARRQWRPLPSRHSQGSRRFLRGEPAPTKKARSFHQGAQSKGLERPSGCNHVADAETRCRSPTMRVRPRPDYMHLFGLVGTRLHVGPHGEDGAETAWPMAPPMRPSWRPSLPPHASTFDPVDAGIGLPIWHASRAVPTP